MTPAEMRELAAKVAERVTTQNKLAAQNFGRSANRHRNLGDPFNNSGDLTISSQVFNEIANECEAIAAAIRAIPLPDGDMVMVPREPTEKLLEDIQHIISISHSPRDKAIRVYRAMLAAKE